MTTLKEMFEDNVKQDQVVFDLFHARLEEIGMGSIKLSTIEKKFKKQVFVDLFEDFGLVAAGTKKSMVHELKDYYCMSRYEVIDLLCLDYMREVEREKREAKARAEEQRILAEEQALLEMEHRTLEILLGVSGKHKSFFVVETLEGAEMEGNDVYAERHNARALVLEYTGCEQVYVDTPQKREAFMRGIERTPGKEVVASTDSYVVAQKRYYTKPIPGAVYVDENGKKRVRMEKVTYGRIYVHAWRYLREKGWVREKVFLPRDFKAMNHDERSEAIEKAIEKARRWVVTSSWK